jgi:hypothetical protein
MSSSNNSNNSSIGFCGLLTIVFITLKICGVIDWSWWGVLAPLWIPFLVVMVCVAAYALALWIESSTKSGGGN